jgi:DNA-binding SARP family transcriptional activator/tetratricopeptide (TPR) repeat protein
LNNPWIGGGIGGGAAVAEIRVLGPVQMWIADRPVDLGPTKQRTVLAALLVDAGQPVATPTLIRRVWGEDPPAAARSGLYSYVTRLRRVLRQTAAADPPVRLVHVPGGYRLDVDTSQVDLLRFRRLAEHARQPDTDDARRSAALDEAIRLWRGEALADLTGEWAARTRDAMAQQRLEVTVQWARMNLRLGPASTVIAPLRELAAQHPLVEPLAALLIEALCRDSRSAEALDHYAKARAGLAAELGVEPGLELRRLYEAILRQDSEAILRQDAEAILRQDAMASTASVASAAAPTPAPAPPVPAQLPLDVHGFTGRERELAALDTILGAGDEQPTAVLIVALWGTAGVGKTATAVHWAHRVAGLFPDGQLYLNLRGFDPSDSPMTPTEAVRAMLDAFGVPPERRPVDLASQVGLYRSLVAGKRVLVVLDNAATVDQVRPLLPGSPGSVVLVTSRTQLNSLVAAEGAHPLTLDLLNAREARELLSARIGRARVTAEPAPVNEIIARCAGLPLALAVVAAQASAQPALDLSGLAGQLRDTRDGLDAFRDADPAVDVRAVFSWSYQKLGAQAAGLFRRLALHPGPDVDVAAAASLAGDPVPRVRATLAELIRAHLVIEHVPGRYTFHDLLRAYATELARRYDTEAERQAALRRLLDHYLHTAHTAARLVTPHRDPISLAPALPGAVAEPVGEHEQALDWFASRHAVLLAAIRAAADAGLDIHAWQLAWTLTSFLDLRTHWQELADTQRTALVAAVRLADLPGQAYAHRILGRALTRLRRYDDADPHYRQALTLCRQLADHIGQAHTHLNLAWLHEQRRNHHDALDDARHALDLYRAANHRAGQASALNQIGWYHAQLDDHAAALTHCQQALELQQETGHRHGQASTWHSLGYAHHHLGDHERAGFCYRKAIDLHRENDDRYREADTLVHLADTYQVAGDVGGARDALQRAAAILDEIDQPAAAHVRATAIRMAHW